MYYDFIMWLIFICEYYEKWIWIKIEIFGKFYLFEKDSLWLWYIRCVYSILFVGEIIKLSDWNMK